MCSLVRATAQAVAFLIVAGNATVMQNERGCCGPSHSDTLTKTSTLPPTIGNTTTVHLYTLSAACAGTSSVIGTCRALRQDTMQSCKPLQCHRIRNLARQTALRHCKHSIRHVKTAMWALARYTPCHAPSGEAWRDTRKHRGLRGIAQHAHH